MGPEILERIMAAVRKQEGAYAIRVLHLWQDATGWSGGWFDVRKPKWPVYDGGRETCQEIAFLVQDLHEIEREAGLTLLHIAPREGHLMAWYRIGDDSPVQYARAAVPAVGVV